MGDLLTRSARFVDEGVYEGPGSVNPVNGKLEEVADGIAMITAFSHVVAFRTGGGLLLFDASLDAFGPMVVAGLESWGSDPVHTLVYTHGHVDHVGGARHLVAAARDAGRRDIRVVAHHAVGERFGRYDRTNGYNAVVNQRQFLGVSGGLLDGGSFPRRWVHPTETFDTRTLLRLGDTEVELRHDLGETDDHAWAWIPEHRAVCSGDFFCWVFPNAGNPQKVQRYPAEWADALRSMAALEPELLLPAHGLPIAGRERIASVLDDTATALETIVAQTLELMNEGATLDQIVHGVELPTELLDRPYLRPIYDEPEFIVHNVWRLYGGWYDGNPAHLKPAPADAVAAELASLAGGAEVLAARARELVTAGDLRLACHLVELAARAAPGDLEVQGARVEVYRERRTREHSRMARGVYAWAEAESAAMLEP